MKVYEVSFNCPAQGYIRRWRRNLKQVAELINDWEQTHPLRELITTESVEIPTDKTEFIGWLNYNATRSP